jgi:hypothetical protein
MRGLIALANSRMTIVDAYRQCGHDIYEAYGAKLYCPWGFLHHDGGTSRSLRLYLDDNSSYCFACSERLDPVGVYRKTHDLSAKAAAERILEDTNYRPPTPEQVWADALAYHPEPDRTALAAALEMYLTDLDPDFEEHALTGVVSHYYSAVLELLSSVHTDEDAALWLAMAKTGMAGKLEISG